jgi:hypothetical protein
VRKKGRGRAVGTGDAPKGTRVMRPRGWRIGASGMGDSDIGELGHGGARAWGAQAWGGSGMGGSGMGGSGMGGSGIGAGKNNKYLVLKNEK